MALEPITRQEQIIAGKDLQPITRMERFLKEYGGGGSGGGVSSWNDLPDKPFGVETVLGAELINGTYTTASIPAYGGAFGADLGFDEALSVVPESIDVVLDGVEYNNLSVTATPAGSLAGNLSKANTLLGTSFADTGEPFVIGISTTGVLLFTTMISSTTHSLIVKLPDVEAVHKLDNKFIDAEWMATRVINKGDVVLGEGEITSTHGGGTNVMRTILDPLKALEAGKSYIVIWDGEEYLCTASTIDGGFIALGNFGISGGEGLENTGEPFLVSYAVDYGSGMLVIDWLTGESHTCGVYEGEKVANPLPEEYMPVLTSPGGKKFKLTVDDSGTVTATEVT